MLRPCDVDGRSWGHNGATGLSMPVRHVDKFKCRLSCACRCAINASLPTASSGAETLLKGRTVF